MRNIIPFKRLPATISCMETGITYEIVRSKRKTLGLRVREDGSVTALAPLHYPEYKIAHFVDKKSSWIKAQQAKQQERALQAQALGGTLSEQELKELVSQAKEFIPKRVAHYATLVGVDYGRITIRKQHSRWGSCSNKGNLNFNCLLMLAPPEVLDSVVVHELCHRKHMNHSPAFYAEVTRAYPHYNRWNKWLKENGPALMMRLPK